MYVCNWHFSSCFLIDGWWAHYGSACQHGYDVEQIYHDSVTGEFSLAVTDCQKYLDGGYADPYVAPGMYVFVLFRSRKN